MLYFDRTDVSEGIDAKKNASKEGDICHYWYFLILDWNFNQISPIDVMIS